MSLKSMDFLKNACDLEKIVNRKRAKNKKIVFTNGCYDIIHKGHVHLLQEASKLGDVLIVGLNSDASVRRFKGQERPKNKQLDRAFVVGGIKGVDYVVIFEEDTPLNLLEILKPDICVKGGAYLPERVAKEKEIIDKYGGEIRFFPLMKGYSTTGIIGRIKNC